MLNIPPFKDGAASAQEIDNVFGCVRLKVKAGEVRQLGIAGVADGGGESEQQLAIDPVKCLDEVKEEGENRPVFALGDGGEGSHNMCCKVSASAANGAIL